MNDKLIEKFLLIKRGLYWRDKSAGYTGLKGDAGRYSKEDAEARINDGVTMIAEEAAPRFSPSCGDEFKVVDLTAENELLRDAAKGILPYVLSEYIHCNGDKCRHPTCASCNGEDYADEQSSKADKAWKTLEAALKAKS